MSHGVDLTPAKYDICKSAVFEILVSPVSDLRIQHFIFSHFSKDPIFLDLASKFLFADGSMACQNS